ncbi:hypothetical protein PHG31p187 [Aeromonas phage 31]|uniref:Uncharacterized protein PHG31ORF189c n=1 Tax=Aeromonas phage 31 TaxID=321023 RepID=Q56EH4_9CAUD|nr:hypothetical protein PHG31p187 [Aeromonas phage 31]AAX63676.1 hypothetical protein PHG31p187 [Aeromonas phage 31]
MNLHVRYDGKEFKFVVANDLAAVTAIAHLVKDGFGQAPHHPDGEEWSIFVKPMQVFRDSGWHPAQVYRGYKNGVGCDDYTITVFFRI